MYKDINSIVISVIICTNNPNQDYLSRVISALQQQTFSFQRWELILVNNRSDHPFYESIDLKWHPNSFIISENQLGLSHARLKGVSAAKGDLIIFVDDDNILEYTYLSRAYDFYNDNKQVGCFSGKSHPSFDINPPNWFKETGINLGCQDLGEKLYISNYKEANFKLFAYPIFAPIGTGMVIQKAAFQKYADEVKNSKDRLSLGRKGISLTSGEDNDIILTIIKNGFELAYLPELVVSHLIPKNRFNFEYLKRMAYQSNQSWIKVLHIHGINPWMPIHPYTLKIRQLKAYFMSKAWKSKQNFIKWKGACGAFKGLSEIYYE